MTQLRERSVAEVIRQSLERLTPTERRSALTLLADYPVAGLETVAQFARRARVSGPTILRLINKLGFRSYPEFQQALRDELEVRLQSPLSKSSGRSPGEPPPEDYLDQFAHAVADNVQQSLRTIPRSEFDAVSTLLANSAHPVYLLGGRFTSSLAVLLYLHLREIRPRVQLISGQTATWVEHLLDMGRRDVLVVFDIRRYQTDIIRFAEQAARRKTSVVLFTDQWLSPIAGVARHVFTLRTGAPSNWESVVTMVTLIEALIAQLNDRSWTAVRRRMETLEALRSQLETRSGQESI